MDVTLKWDGDLADARSRRGAIKGLELAGEHILAEATLQVPHEEGTLERSGVASVDEVELKGAVSFDTVYAVRQHEELTWRHDPGRNAKYLEIPMRVERDVALGLMAAQIRRALRS